MDKFWTAYIKVTVIGFCIIGVLQLQIMQFQVKYGEEGISGARELGRKEVMVDAINLGYARNDGGEFIWNTNIFNSIEVAINSVLETSDRDKQLSIAVLSLIKRVNGVRDLQAQLDEMDKR